jgi:hypothetical protein
MHANMRFVIESARLDLARFSRLRSISLNIARWSFFLDDAHNTTRRTCSGEQVPPADFRRNRRLHGDSSVGASRSNAWTCIGERYE